MIYTSDAIDALANRFNYHPANTPERQKAHENVREDLKHVAINLLALLPEGREKSLAFTKLEEAMFWANAAIARQP